jgi:hypothetical protein
VHGLKQGRFAPVTTSEAMDKQDLRRMAATCSPQGIELMLKLFKKALPVADHLV